MFGEFWASVERSIWMLKIPENYSGHQCTRDIYTDDFRLFFLYFLLPTDMYVVSVFETSLCDFRV